MGRDKATLVVDGQAMAARVAAALKGAGAAEVWAVGGDPGALAALGLSVLPDEHPGGGPLPATVTALRGSVHEVVAVLSCDLLHPSEAAIGALVDALHAASPSVLGAVPVVAGHHQWTHAAWRRSAARSLDALYMTGIGSLRRAASGLSLVEVQGIEPAAVADADEPAELPATLRGVATLGASLHRMEIPDIDVVELVRQRAAGAALIDVREPTEFAEAHVPGATLIPLGEVVERISEVPTEGTVYVICARGSRSAKAVEHYRSLGIDAVNVAGGTLAWIDAGHSTDAEAPRDGGL